VNESFKDFYKYYCFEEECRKTQAVENPGFSVQGYFSSIFHEK